MKILYFSVHEVLEYDDLLMLTSLGHRVCSMGLFLRPGATGEGYRTPKSSFFDQELVECYDKLGLTSDFIKMFDVVIFNHNMLLLNHLLAEGLFSRVPIIFRTIGQSDFVSEYLAEKQADAGRITIVRYSECEVNLPAFARTDAVIYFSKDLKEYPTWIGGADIVTFHNNYVQRSDSTVPDINEYCLITEKLPALLYSEGNQQVANWQGRRIFEEMLEIYSLCSGYLYAWSAVASYTLNLIEAMIVGAPVIAPSLTFVRSRWRALEPRGWFPSRYEVDSFVQGTTYDTLDEARLLIRRAMARDPQIIAAAAEAQKRACERFDMKRIAPQWEVVLCQA